MLNVVNSFVEVQMISIIVSMTELYQFVDSLAIGALLVLLIASQLMNHKTSTRYDVRILETFSIPLIALFVVVAIVRIINIIV
jgi:hypothetical protein